MASQQALEAAFANSLLRRLGIPVTAGARQALVGWEHAEGGHFNNDAKFNPLNTTQSEPGAGNTGSQGNIKQYRSWGQGLDATVKTLKNGNYGGILQALRRGDPGAVASAIGASPWGTSAAGASGAIAGASGGATSRTLGELLRGSSGGGSGSSPSSEAPNPAQAPAQSSPWDLGSGSTSGVDVLAAALQSQRPVVQSSGVADPAFSARANLKMPQGYQAPAAGGGPQPKADALGDALRAVAASSVTDLPAASGSAVQASPQAAGGGSAGGGAGGGAGAVDFAAARVGHYKENRGSNRGDELDTLQKRFGLTGQAWCAMFATTAAAHGGASRAVRTPSVAQINTWAREGSHGYEKGLRSDREAQAGDLITFGNAHVGVVDFVDDKGVHTIEGNTGNGQVDKRLRPFGSGKIARPVYG